MRIVFAPSLIGVNYPYKGIPDALFQVVETLLHHEDSGKKDELKEFSTGEDEIIVSKYAKDLVIADNGVRISPDPKTWKCADSGMTENLWLNLSDGYIGSGRKQYVFFSIDYTFLSINYNAQFKGTED
jgi:ubiquitin carboxyl-terminal hydrolase 5/13